MCAHVRQHSPQPTLFTDLELLTLQVTDVSAQLTPDSQPEKEGPLHQCLDCDRAFSSAAVLMHHSKEVHGKERIHGCRVCRKAFKRATHLKVHRGAVGSPQLQIHSASNESKTE